MKIGEKHIISMLLQLSTPADSQCVQIMDEKAMEKQRGDNLKKKKKKKKMNRPKKTIKICS